MTHEWTAECAANHLGLWLARETWLTSAVELVKAGAYPMAAQTVREEGTNAPLYTIENGVAAISMNGPMMKGESKFGGVSTVRVRRALRDAAANDKVGAILISGDSPGGTVAGTAALADDLRRANGMKPVLSHINDMGASAFYWAVSGAHSISASPTSFVGSIGVVAVVEDRSKMLEKRGIEVHVISTGPHKGAFMDGAPVPDHHLEELQNEVNLIHERFGADVKSGRGMDDKQFDRVADGRVFIDSQALELGLIDHVRSQDDTMAEAQALAGKFLRDKAMRSRRQRQARAI